MSDRLNPQLNNATNPGTPPTNGAPRHPAITAPLSQNVPQCPAIQKFSPPIASFNNSIPPNCDNQSPQSTISNSQSAITPDNIPEYTPADADTPDPDEPPLSPQQQHAIHLLLQGLSDTAVAKRLGLNRKTIYRWKWHTPLFYNTLDEAQRQAWNEAYGLLRSSILQSAQKLNRIIKKGEPRDAIKAARVLLSAPVLTRLEG